MTLIEQSNSSPRRTVALALALAFGLALLVVSFPWKTGGLTGSIVSPLWSAALAGLVAWSLLRGMVLIALVPALFGMAYAPYLGDHLELGVARLGAIATPMSVLTAVVLLVLFLSLVVLGAMACEILLSHWWPRQPLGSEYARTRDHVALALLTMLFVASFYSAARTGFWTYYGVGREVQQVAGMRLELHYPQLLFALMAILVTARRSTLVWISLTVLALLLFLLQQRRLMIAATALFVLEPLVGQQRASATAGDATRSASDGVRNKWANVLLAGALVLGFAGSAAWRSGATSDLGTFERVQAASTTFQREGATERRKFEDRFTYLWIDALSVEYGSRLRFSLGEAAAGTLARATPGVLFPDKLSIPDHTCENAFRRIGFSTDLPCTATSEGYLAFGVWGVILVALIWAPFLGVASYWYRHASTGARLCGLLLFSPLIDVETQAFPIVRGVRLLLIFGVSVVVAAAVIAAIMTASSTAPRLGRNRGGYS